MLKSIFFVYRLKIFSAVYIPNNILSCMHTVLCMCVRAACYKRYICYHLQSKWTGPFGRKVEKLIMWIRMVSDSFRWGWHLFITRHLKQIHAKNPQEFVFSHLQGNIKRAQWINKRWQAYLHQLSSLIIDVFTKSSYWTTVYVFEAQGVNTYVWFKKMKSWSGIRCLSINVATRLDWMFHRLISCYSVNTSLYFISCHQIENFILQPYLNPSDGNHNLTWTNFNFRRCHLSFYLTLVKISWMLLGCPRQDQEQPSTIHQECVDPK